jgi:small-conductance mechanosensitive channel
MGDRVQLGGIKGDVMDIGVKTTIMETGQWVDGDLYNGRIVLIANSYVLKSLYLIIQETSLFWMK